VHYWRGFGLWRRAINGFNQNAEAKDLAADLERAVTEFERAVTLAPTFADAKLAIASCLQGLAFIRRNDATLSNGGLDLAALSRLFKELTTSASDNPRFLWVQGASLWYALPGLSDAEIATRRERALATYQLGLRLAREAAPSSDPLEPSWGEPELLMNLAWSYLHANTPDLAAAESYANQALALVPDWQYVRDMLLAQIRQTRSQRRLDVFVGRWTAKGRTHAVANASASDTTGVVINRRTARDNWLLSEVRLDGVPPYGVTVVMAPTPDASYVAFAVNNLVPMPLQYAGRWLDDRVLELEMLVSASGRRQRVRYTVLSDTQMEFLVTESRDEGRTYVPHSSLTLTKEADR
jgi:tetratricopeptide (TPR) repeat protein